MKPCTFAQDSRLSRGIVAGSFASERRGLYLDLDFRLTFQLVKFRQKARELVLQVRLIPAGLADKVPIQEFLDHAPQLDVEALRLIEAFA